MQECNSRLKTEGAFLCSSNVQKYGEQLKNELQEISKMLAKRHKNKKEEEFKAEQKKRSSNLQSSTVKSKNIVTQLDQSMIRRSKDREREHRRNFIYEVEAGRQEEEESNHKVQSKTKSPEKVSDKSPYSQTMSTVSSHTKHKQSQFQVSMSFEDFSLGKKLGEGKFGEVFVAQHKKTGFICALKRINRNRLDEKLIVQLCRQIKIQAFLNHPNIVKLYAFFRDQKYVYLVQELCYSGQLYSLLKRKRRMPQELTKIIIQQICRAMDYMHECEIIHRDIKPQNIIYHSGMVKICDFGWSIGSKTLRQTFCGTPLYVSPELITRKCYNNKIDVWSIGILTYQLLFGRVPFEIVSQKDFLKILEDQIKFSKATPVSDQAKDFVKSCLSKDPRDRYTVPQLLEHDFIRFIESTTLAELY